MPTVVPRGRAVAIEARRDRRVGDDPRLRCSGGHVVGLVPIDAEDVVDVAVREHRGVQGRRRPLADRRRATRRRGTRCRCRRARDRRRSRSRRRSRTRGRRRRRQRPRSGCRHRGTGGSPPRRSTCAPRARGRRSSIDFSGRAHSAGGYLPSRRAAFAARRRPDQALISTGVPSGRSPARRVMLSLLILTHPWVTLFPSTDASLLPWMPSSPSPPLNVVRTSECPESP